jgi:D-alanyl-lipoteichoic acid acyltransferase DltB (MBOAT superfamily)
VQNAFLLLVSYGLYALWDIRALGLLILITLLSYGVAKLMETSSVRLKKTLLILDVIINVGVLFVFKYYDFFASEFCSMLSIDDDKLLLNLILPVGISFYIFTTTGYVIDIFRKTRPAEKNVINYMSFISFFPLILSGPIERSNGLLPQFSKRRDFTYTQQTEGIQQLAWGFFKKLVIADNCAEVVNVVFGNYSTLPASSLWIGAILYSLQIYFDFSGYSDIAIGFSKMFGFKVRRNFNYPYISINIADFWRRWHMSLQQWFTDYIYFPLGGSRCSLGRTIFNTFVVFAVCGIWHGANWTFIVWGLYNAFLFVPYILFLKGRTKKTISNETKLPSITDCVQILVTFFFVTIGWVMFNSSTLADGVNFIVSGFNSTLLSVPLGIKLRDFWFVGLLIIVVLIMEWTQKDKEFALLFKAPGWVKVSVIYAIIAMMVFCKAGSSDFIYFQF